MKQRKYRYLIVLSTIALVGILGVQFAWIYQGYKRTEAFYNEQLSKALAATIDDINLQEEIAFIAAFSNEDDSLKEREVNVIRSRSFHITDSGSMSEHELDSMMKQLELNTRKIVEQKRAGQQQFIQMEVISRDGERQEEIKMEWQSDDALEEVMELEREGRLADLIQRIEMENRLGNLNWPERIDSAQIHKKLIQQLDDHGIGEDFEFAVVNPKGDPFDHFASNGFTWLHGRPSAKARLFPADLKAKNVFLEVYLPNGFAAILTELWLMALLSLGFTALMLVMFFITIRKLMSQSRLSQMKSDFINNMSHELKTPLATISLAADAIRHPASLQSPELITGFSDTIKKEHNRMHKHIERVLQMAEQEKGEFELQKEECDVNQVIIDLSKSLELMLKEHNASLKLDLPDRSISALIDPLHFRSVLINLIDNGLKYNKENPEVKVTLSDQNQHIEVKVIDNGIGISPEHQKMVFSRFYRVEGGNLHGVKGFGLGLSYVRMVVEAHGGTISLASELGKGSTFTIQIPKR